MTSDFQAYLRDLVLFLEEQAEETRKSSHAEETASEFESGRALAYVEVLSHMRSQADSFLIPREQLSLDGLDPVQQLANAAKAARDKSLKNEG